MKDQRDAKVVRRAKLTRIVALGTLLAAGAIPAIAQQEPSEASASESQAIVAMPTMPPMATMTAGLLVRDAWTRESPMLELAGAAFMVIENTTTEADALTGAVSPAAEIVELHQTTMATDGTMAMAPVESIPVPAGGVAVLEPGGYHLMLIGLSAPLKVGMSIEIELRFEHASPRTVSALVRPMTPMGIAVGGSAAPTDD